MSKIAVITGGSRGIGEAIAKQLAADGMTVVINYNGSEDKALKVKHDIVKNGGSAEVYKCNISDFAACEEFIKWVIKEMGSLDVLVNNAGITKDNLLMKMSEEEFDQVLNINLKGTFNTIRFSARQMLKQRSGKIINITSVVGITGNAGQANYASSKAGVIGLTKSTAREVASRGIQVNAVAPGFISTDMTEELPDQVKETSKNQIPLGTFGEAKDVANCVSFLASDKANYITGQVINVDGGMVM
ncbi:MAG: 3-oxoacyl-[acyl-carrier-protein] reductase [Suipraeoptans sp.]